MTVKKKYMSFQKKKKCYRFDGIFPKKYLCNKMVIPSSHFHNSERHFQVPLAQKGCAGSSDEGSGGAGKLRSSCDPCWQEVIDNKV